MSKSYSVTSAGVNPAKDRAHRMRMYYIAMSLRVLCVVSLFWVRGWWVLLVAIGAAVLPWFAVMVGNAVAYGGETKPEAPNPRQLRQAEPPVANDSDTGPVIVVDVEPTRRGGQRLIPLEGAAGAGDTGAGDSGAGNSGAENSGHRDPTEPDTGSKTNGEGKPR